MRRKNRKAKKKIIARGNEARRLRQLANFILNKPRVKRVDKRDDLSELSEKNDEHNQRIQQPMRETRERIDRGKSVLANCQEPKRIAVTNSEQPPFAKPSVNVQETEEEHAARIDETLLRMQGRSLAWRWFAEDPARIAPGLEAKAAEARVLIALTKRQIDKGELEFGPGANEIEHHLQDYAVIAAVKMARKDLTIAQWNGEMI